MKKNIFHLSEFKFWISLALFTLSGCSRPSVEKSNLSIQLPKATLAATKGNLVTYSTLDRIVINVSGPGIAAPFVLEWDSEHPNPLCSSSSCTAIVPSGDNRLIQVLAIYEETDGTYGLYYDDQIKSLTLPDESAELYLNPVVTAGSLKETRLSGRFLNATASGPTGKLEVRYSPLGKQPMVLLTTEMFNGWFSAFGIVGLPFDYVVDGVSLFGGPIDPSIFSLKLDGSLLEMDWPPFYRKEPNGTLRRQDAIQEYVGFFGPAKAAINKVCFSSTKGPFSDLFKDINNNALSYNASSITDKSQTYVAGGGDPNLANCSVGDVIKYDPMEGHGQLELNGPFRRSANGDLLAMSSSNGIGTFSWEYLPGANAQLSKLRLFAVNPNIIDSLREKFNNGMRCNEIDRRANNNDPDIVRLTEFDATLITATTTLPNIGIQSPVGVLCPIGKNGMIYNSAAVMKKSNDGGGGSCTNCYSINNFWSTTPVNNCMSFDVSNPTGNSILVNMTASRAGGSFYSTNTDCNGLTNSITNYTFATGQTSIKLYYRTPSTGGPATITTSDGDPLNAYNDGVANISNIYDNTNTDTCSYVIGNPQIFACRCTTAGQFWDNTISSCSSAHVCSAGQVWSGTSCITQGLSKFSQTTGHGDVGGATCIQMSATINTVIDDDSMEDVNLSDNGAGGGFYSDTGCTTSFTSVHAMNTGTFYYKSPSTFTNIKIKMSLQSNLSDTSEIRIRMNGANICTAGYYWDPGTKTCKP